MGFTSCILQLISFIKVIYITNLLNYLINNFTNMFFFICLRYKHLSKKSIELLKKENYIPKDIDVQHNILSFINYPKELYPKDCDDSLTWNQIQRNVFQLFVGWKINMDLDRVTYAQTVYHRLSNKSFRLMDRAIDILLNEIHFSEERVNIFNFDYLICYNFSMYRTCLQIKRHSYLIHSDPDNTIGILNNLDSICGMEVKRLLRKHPKIILTRWETIEQIQKYFEV